MVKQKIQNKTSLCVSIKLINYAACDLTSLQFTTDLIKHHIALAFVIVNLIKLIAKVKKIHLLLKN